MSHSTWYLPSSPGKKQEIRYKQGTRSPLLLGNSQWKSSQPVVKSCTLQEEAEGNYNHCHVCSRITHVMPSHIICLKAKQTQFSDTKPIVPTVQVVLTPPRDLLQTQRALLTPFSFGIFSCPLSTAEKSMHCFSGNNQFSISFPGNVTNKYHQENCALNKITRIDRGYWICQWQN